MEEFLPPYTYARELPLLYVPSLHEQVELDAANYRYAVQVLRMRVGDRLLLTNGIGQVAEAVLKELDRRSAWVQLESVAQQAPPPARWLGVALPHHTGRAEWLIEKATELGVTRIYPLLTARSTHSRWKPDRYRQLMIAAMLQSRQYYLPELSSPIAFADWIQQCNASIRAIAHCEPGSKSWIWTLPTSQTSVCVLIGPEGDFTPEEIQLARALGWQEVSLGDTRLRTETAAIVACAWMQAATISSS
ncbi:MAG: 16S rRNA (uracil(1498)-N(3))-methyltransferase [Thermoflavifilum sp.]|nr:16S rRNA (uracil(1498)-N(3))-methyltransferase [Thermoflavifilum sp.]